MSRQPTPREIEIALQQARELLADGRPREALPQALTALHLALESLHGSLLTLRDNLAQVQAKLARLKKQPEPAPPEGAPPKTGLYH